MSEKWTKWLWLVFLPGGPIIIVIVVQLIANTPLNTPLSSGLAITFLATVAQVLAGILAIVFSVSVLAVDIAADKYTPRLFSYFAGNWATRLSFFSILALMIFSVVAMGVQDIPMSQWRYLSMAGLFALCLLTLPYYFYQMLQLLDPRNLAERIRNESQRGLKNQDHQKTLDAITSLGDIAIKALERGEDEITKKYLDTLHEIGLQLVTQGAIVSNNPEKDTIRAQYGFGIESPIFHQYYRVFRVAISRRTEEMTLHIAGLVSDTIRGLTQQGDSTENLKGTLRQYEDFLRLAIESKDTSRFPLIHAFRDILLPHVFLHIKVVEGYVPLILNTFKRVNETIIDQQDFDLWKAELSYFSSISSLNDIHFSLSSDLRGLLLRDDLFDSNWAWLEQMDMPLRTRITLTNKRVLELGLFRMSQLMPETDQELQEKLDRIRDLLYRLGITTGIYDVFFWICAYAFYRKQFSYIKELWRHINPEDAGVHWVNTNLVHFDIGFLTSQMVSQVSFPDTFEDYHSKEFYILRYYLLCLAYTLQRNQNDWHPSIPFLFKPSLWRDDEYSETMRQELQTTYTFLINLPYYADKALAQYDTVVSEKEEWEDVFDGKTSDALEQARDWLTDTQRRQEWISKAEEIIRDLPLDNKRVEAYQKTALEYYESESQIKHLAIQTESSDEQNAVTLIGRWLFQPPDKKHFTLIGLDQPERIGARVGFVAVHELVKLEIDHIAKLLFTEKERETTPIEGLDFDSILKAVEKIKQAGYAATVLMAPSQEISSAWRKDHQFRANMRYENQKDRYLQVDTDTQLRIIELSGDCALIFGEAVCTWTTIVPAVIEVNECDKNPLLVQITARETVNYQISIPEAVEILKFNSSFQQKPKPRNRFLTWLFT